MTTATATPILRGIPVALIDVMWHYAEPYLKRALDHTNGELLLEDLHTLCLERAVQLWLVSMDNRVVGAITTELVNYPRRKHCRVITLAGSNFEDWVSAADATLAEWAKSQGCSAIESFVRKGLVPKMAHLNYKHKHSILVKEIQHE